MRGKYSTIQAERNDVGSNQATKTNCIIDKHPVIWTSLSIRHIVEWRSISVTVEQLVLMVRYILR